MKNKKVYGVIYMVKNLHNQKVYIGQTTQQGGFDRRYKHNLYKNTSNIHLKRAIEKEMKSIQENIDNDTKLQMAMRSFSVDKEYDVADSQAELDKKEKEYIALFHANDQRYGYNIEEGGSAGPLAEETKQKLREANLGKRYTKETNMKKALPGEKNGMFGKHHSENSIEMMSKNRKGKAMGKNSPRALPVVCITTGDVFMTNREAGEYFGIRSYDHITRVCRHQLKTCGELLDGTRLKWSYVQEKVYTVEEVKNREKGALKRAKRVLCVTTNRPFNSLREAGQFYHIKYFRHISEVCCGHSMSCGKLPDGTPLKWKYLE